MLIIISFCHVVMGKMIDHRIMLNDEKYDLERKLLRTYKDKTFKPLSGKPNLGAYLVP